MTESPLVVAITDIRRVFEQLMDHLASVTGPEVRLEVDYFWSIPREELFDMDSQPSELTVGQLFESWDNLTAHLDDPSWATSYSLVWLADVLRAIGHEVVP